MPILASIDGHDVQCHHGTVYTQFILLESLLKSYGRHPAVRDMSLAIPHGEIVGLLGPNGVGKSTTIAMLTGLLTQSRGGILWEGSSIFARIQMICLVPTWRIPGDSAVMVPMNTRTRWSVFASMCSHIEAVITFSSAGRAKRPRILHAL